VVDPRDCDPESAKEESTSDLKKSVRFSKISFPQNNFLVAVSDQTNRHRIGVANSSIGQINCVHKRITHN
jgi:hypothetical protein